MIPDKQSSQSRSPQPNAPDGAKPPSVQGKAQADQDEYPRPRDARRDSRGSRGHDRVQVVVAIGLIGLYVTGLWVMFQYRNDRQWDRMVYLFSGYEAIVLVAVAAIFGTRIQRASVESVAENAQHAREDLASERHRSHGATERAARASALATAVKGYAAWQAQEQDPDSTAPRERPGARGGGSGHAAQAGSSSTGLDPGLAVLLDLAEEVLGQQPQREWRL